MASLERPLLLVGLVLVTTHLLDLSLSGPDTTVLGVALILALPALVWALAPHVGRVTRFALFTPAGLAFAAAGILAHVLDLFTSGPRWSDVTGVGCAFGGLSLVAAGCAALAGSPRRAEPTVEAPPRRARHRLGGRRDRHRCSSWSSRS